MNSHNISGITIDAYYTALDAPGCVYQPISANFRTKRITFNIFNKKGIHIQTLEKDSDLFVKSCGARLKKRKKRQRGLLG